MSPTPLLDWTPPEPRGETYSRERDGKRLSAQATRVYKVMLYSGWKTLAQISAATNDPEASVSARLRDLRRVGFTIDREYVKGCNGLWRYRLVIS